METLNVNKFVEIFNEIKTKEKGRKGTTKGLSEKDERNFKKLIKRGYDETDFKAAITQMFRDPDQWAISTGNDIPAHFLRSDNFERYFNEAINVEEEKPKEEKPETPKIDRKKREEEEAKQRIEEHLNESKALYSESLKRGEWIGSPNHAAVIAEQYFKDLIDKETKQKIWRQIEEENKEAGRFEKSIVIKKIIKTSTKFINPVREFSNRVVIEAVKRKIVEPWKQEQ